MADEPRLIERAFPLKQASLDSVHEKNVRHGHISTLHIWPARRPLAACRAALIATLLPDPGSPEARRELCEKIGGKVVQKTERKRMPNGRVVERIKEETEGGILHWKRETENAEDLNWFRQKIREAYGGRAPRVLDPFAGGGAIPLEAMRLGCEATAVDINPVAWFILKCTLEYPQKLAGMTRPLPDFILRDFQFMEAFLTKAKGYSKARAKNTLEKLGRRPRKGEQRVMDYGRESAVDIEADLAWHVRAWGHWVLNRARRELARFYPTYADFEPLDRINPRLFEKQAMQLVPLRDDGTPDIDALNAELSQEYLEDRRNPRWVAKPTVAYLWARTVTCKNCRATVPLLKTRWLCKKDNKRVLLTMKPNADKSGVVFGIQKNVPVEGGNTAQKRERDKLLGGGTMTRAGTKCPCCGTIMTMGDIRVEGQFGRLDSVMTVVIIEGQSGKEYRLPEGSELSSYNDATDIVPELFRKIPYGLPEERLPGRERHRAVGSQLPGYGHKTFRDLFCPRQLLSLGSFILASKAATETSAASHDKLWHDVISHYLAICVDKIADYGSTLATWIIGMEIVRGTFARFAFSWNWDWCEVNPLSNSSGAWSSALDWTAQSLSSMLTATKYSLSPDVKNGSAIKNTASSPFDLVFTDPPYYDAIPYADLMDFFFVWLKRSLSIQGLDDLPASSYSLSPNWEPEAEDGELIDDPGAYSGDRARSKAAYEDGMANAFHVNVSLLDDDGRLVIVFANKQPNAWESLVSALVKAGCVVVGTWPIQSERGMRTNAISTASLASSVWLVCKKRPVTARPGWDNKVLEEMRHNITERLRDYWDSGIRGPDFVWAATGPALEAYSKHPIVKKANDPGQVMAVGEFLSHVRRMVVDFVVGQVLTGDNKSEDLAAADRMDTPTAYYLLHRHDFGLEEAPSGACILYATACGLSDRDLETTWDILVRTGDSSNAPDETGYDEEVDPDAEPESDVESDSGSKVKLKNWSQRKSKSMGYEAPGGRSVPLIDRIHRLMHLWRTGDAQKVDEYLDDNGLRRQELFKRLLQSLIELSPENSEERALLESLSNHVQGKGAPVQGNQRNIFGNME